MSDCDVVFVSSEDVEQSSVDVFPGLGDRRIVLVTHGGDRSVPAKGSRLGPMMLQ